MTIIKFPLADDSATLRQSGTRRGETPVPSLRAFIPPEGCPPSGLLETPRGGEIPSSRGSFNYDREFAALVFSWFVLGVPPVAITFMLMGWIIFFG